MKRVHLLTTGGTIASRAATPGGDVVASDSAEALVATLHRRPDNVRLTVEEFANIGSSALCLDMALGLATRIRDIVASGAADGIVVTHGTDTMEETAFLCELLVAGDTPIVFTGAQRDAGYPDTDGPRNLADAICLAGSDAAKGLGALIVFEGDFHAARDVAKTHTARTDTFRSAGYGRLGELDDGVVFLNRRPARRATALSGHAISPDVELVRMALGMSDRLVRCAVADGASGLVLEGFGRGNATPAVAAAVGGIVAQGIPVVVTSRCAEGRVRPIYGNGGGRDLERAGAIFAGELSGPKARIALALAVGEGQSMDEVARLFAELA